MTYSIIIPVHNAFNRIGTLLAQIRRQTDGHDVELITVCDSCSDNSAYVCGMYTPNVVEVGYGNAGDTRNKGLDMAKGEYILFMDDDDRWMHDKVFEMIDWKMQQVKGIDIMQYSFYWDTYGVMPAQKANGTVWANVWSKVWRRDFIGDTRFPNKRQGEDLDFVNECLSKSPSMVYWENCLYFYNWSRPDSLSKEVQ